MSPQGCLSKAPSGGASEAKRAQTRTRAGGHHGVSALRAEYGPQGSTPGMAEAIVVGGGVMGLAAGRELQRRGYAVTLLERGQPGRAASWASAGIIGATLRDESDPSYHLRRVSRALWPAFAKAIHDESGMDPEYREMGCIQLASDGDELAVLQRATQRQAGS